MRERTSTAQAPVGTTTGPTGREVGVDAPRAGKSVRTRACAHCGEMFDPVREHQAFCRPSCRFAHRSTRSTPTLAPVGDRDELVRLPFE